MLTDEVAIPELVAQSRPLAEAHRLELALFVAFEEAALRTTGSLLQHAPDADAAALAAAQVADERRHHEHFCRHLDTSLAAATPDRGRANEAMLLRLLQGTRADGSIPLRRAEVAAAVVIPPLRRYLGHCSERADAGQFAEALLLLNVLLKGMAGALADYEGRYWDPVDPVLADIIRATARDESRHVEQAALWLASRPSDEKLAALAGEALPVLREVFGYYVRKFVELFHVVTRQHAGLFAGVEMEHGRPLVETAPAEQVGIILGRCAAAVEHTLARAGVACNGRQESFSHP